jgi:O-acetylserine/cysteine efflux transporter
MMRLSDILIVLLVVATWGINFVAIKFATETMPPVFLAGLRMVLTGFPLVFFIKKPATSWKWIVAYGLSIFTFNFGFLFAGMKLGMSAGLTSLVFQTQIFFTVGLSALFFKERVKPVQIFCALLAFSGIIAIAIHRGGTMTPIGLTFVLLACLSWAIGNIVSKKIGKVNLLALVAWGGIIASVPLLLFSYFVEGASFFSIDWSALSAKQILAIAFLVYPTTMMAFSLWSALLNKYPAPTLVPFTLLVPIFGVFSGAVLLNESFDIYQACGALLVFVGVSVNVLASLPQRILKRNARDTSSHSHQ